MENENGKWKWKMKCKWKDMIYNDNGGNLNLHKDNEKINDFMIMHE